MHVSSAEADVLMDEIAALALQRREPLTARDLLELVRRHTHADSPAEFEVQVREHANGALLGFLQLGVTYATEQERRLGTLWVSPDLLAKQGANQRPSDDALSRLGSGDLVSDAELRAALEAAYDRASSGEGWSVQGSQRVGHAEDSGDEAPPLPGHGVQRPEPGGDDGQVEAPDAHDGWDGYADGLAEAAAHAASQPAEQATVAEVVDWLTGTYKLSEREDAVFQAAVRAWHADTDKPPLESLSLEELRRRAWESGSTINHTLARMFLKLGPPPEGAGGDMIPVASDGGGAQQ